MTRRIEANATLRQRLNALFDEDLQQTRTEFAAEIDQSNLLRLGRIAWVLLAMHLVHLAVFTTRTKSPANTQWLVELSWLHGVMSCVVAVIGVLALTLRGKHPPWGRLLSFFAAAAYLVFAGLVLAADQRIGALPLAFLVACISVGYVVQLPAIYSAAAYVLGMAVALIALETVGLPAELQTSVSVNIVAFAAIGWGLGHMQYLAAKRRHALLQTIADKSSELERAFTEQQAYSVLLAQEVEARKRTETQLQSLLTTDHLTGAMTRRHLFEHSGRLAGGLVLADVDFFKNVNDQHGHAAGDAVLRGVVERLQDALRPGDFIARIGGEEFAVLLPQATPEATARVAERLRVAVEATPFEVPGGTLAVTISAGWTLVRPDLSLEQALQEADGGLYAAKRAGRNRVVQADGSTPGGLHKFDADLPPASGRA